MERMRKYFRIALIGFFLFMLIGTAASRIYDSVSVPKVLTAYPKRKSVETVVAGTGTVKEKETAFCEIYPGLKVESVAVTAGSEVKAGDELFRFQTASVLAKKGELETELEKIRLNLQRMEVASEAYAGVSQSELAARQLQLAQQKLAEGQQEYQVKWADHFVNLKNLENDYMEKKKLNDDELLLQQEQQLESAGTQLRTARASRETEITDAERKIEDLKETISRTPEGDASRQELEKQLSRAREDLETLQEQWAARISDLQYSREILKMQNDRILNGKDSAQTALKEAYDAEVEQENAAWEAEEEKLAALEQSVEDAQWNLQVASRQDEQARLTADQQTRLSQIDQELQEMNRASVEREIGELENILAAEGKVTAALDGTVVMQELTAGRTSTGEERLSIAYGNRIFEAEFNKKEQDLAVGDLLAISIPGSSRTVEARITEMNLLGEETGILQAELGEMNLAIGTVTSYQCRRLSDTYPTVIPLSALRRDMEGYYCLAIRTRSTVMGEEFRAERVALQVLEQGDSEAAVDGAVFETDQLITAGSQVIFAGDRVRPVEDLQG